MSVVVRKVGADDWAMYRALRLAALEEAPYAFGSVLAEQREYPEAWWRARIDRPGQFVAFLDGAPVGLAGGFPGKVPESAELVSMWVAPEARGYAVGEALVAAVAAWARTAHYRVLRLWVTEGNDRAEQLYVRCGFERTGEVQAVGRPGDPDRREFAMARTLGPTD